MRRSKIVGSVIAGGKYYSICRNADGKQFVVSQDGQRVSKRKMFAETIEFINQVRATIHAVT